MVRPAAPPPSFTRLGAPKYLRVVVTRRCPLSCTYCHAEGDPGTDTLRPTNAERAALILVGASLGVRKVKFLGGEPLVDQGLPDLVRRLRADDATLDLSVITSGVAGPDRIDALFDAGLSRANLSVHGFDLDAFARRGGTPRMHALRDGSLERLITHGRPLKLNYVYSGPDDEPDLDRLLTWAAPRPVVVNVLDELGADLGPSAVLEAVRRLRGPEADLRVEPDAMSLDTLRLSWTDGLEVEVKHQRLGELAPWKACATCPLRARCGEGIHAFRLDFEGVLRPCMDRPDLRLPLLPLLRERGPVAVRDAWAAWSGEVAS